MLVPHPPHPSPRHLASTGAGGGGALERWKAAWVRGGVTLLSNHGVSGWASSQEHPEASAWNPGTGS